MRDNACDLGIDGLQLDHGIIIHHMNPVSIDDVVDLTDYLTNPEYLICCSHATHNAIHYGYDIQMEKPFAERYENDQCPWR